MKTITIDIIDSKALKLLEDLELLQLIRLRRETIESVDEFDWKEKYKGAISKQPLFDIDHQLKALRNEWE
jgi:hypothetical protein